MFKIPTGTRVEFDSLYKDRLLHGVLTCAPPQERYVLVLVDGDKRPCHVRADRVRRESHADYSCGGSVA